MYSEDTNLREDMQSTQANCEDNCIEEVTQSQQTNSEEKGFKEDRQCDEKGDQSCTIHNFIIVCCILI